MKKIIVALAIGLTAAGYSATLEWGGYICQSDGNTATAADSIAYLVYSSSDLSGKVGTTFSSTTAWGSGTSIVDTHTITSSESSGWQFADSYVASAGTMGGYYAVVINEKGTSDYGAYAKGPFVFADDTAVIDMKLQSGWNPGQYLASNGSGSMEAVPEPTSGFLMLLGLAGLALRRRRA